MLAWQRLVMVKKVSVFWECLNVVALAKESWLFFGPLKKSDSPDVLGHRLPQHPTQDIQKAKGELQKRTTKCPGSLHLGVWYLLCARCSWFLAIVGGGNMVRCVYPISSGLKSLLFITFYNWLFVKERKATDSSYFWKGRNKNVSCKLIFISIFSWYVNILPIIIVFKTLAQISPPSENFPIAIFTKFVLFHLNCTFDGMALSIQFNI